MKIFKRLISILIILMGVSVVLYAIELAFFPKVTPEFETSHQAFQVLDVNYKLRANKLAVGKDKRSGGWYVSDNEAQKIDNEFSERAFFLSLSEKELTLVEDTFIANKLYLVNNTDTSICLPAQDSRLYLKMQAKNMLGVWSDIEYIPNSWCGNSYHEICIDKGEFWVFPSLQFKGRHKTKFRYKLENGEHDLYSNEIEGYVNNGQFINKQSIFQVT